MRIRFKCKGKNNWKELGLFTKTMVLKLPKNKQSNYKVVGYSKQPFKGDFIDIYSNNDFLIKTLLNNKDFMKEQEKTRKRDGAFSELLRKDCE